MERIETDKGLAGRADDEVTPVVHQPSAPTFREIPTFDGDERPELATLRRLKLKRESIGTLDEADSVAIVTAALVNARFLLLAQYGVEAGCIFDEAMIEVNSEVDSLQNCSSIR